MLYARVNTAEGHFGTAAGKKLFFDQILQRVAALPGVSSASESLSLPPLWADGSEITVFGKGRSQHWESLVELCGESYFQTLGLRLLRDRLLSQTDIDSVRHVAVFNQAFARAYFGAENPLQQRIKINVFDQLCSCPDWHLQRDGLLRRVADPLIGVRIALGAHERDVLTMVLSQGLRLISTGILIGVLASLALTRFLAGQIPGVSLTDPLTFSAVVIVSLASGSIACLLPARRAARLDPLLALRQE
jgi:hypothetical protein